MDDVGRRLKEVRKGAGLSQRELAKRAGVTNSTISMIEKNNVSPSISSLRKVLGGIPISLLEFFDSMEARQSDIPVVYRADDVHTISTDGGITWAVFGKNFPNRQMNLMMETYPPGSDTGFERFTHDGEEAGIIISGAIELTVDDQVYLLKPGEGYYFESTRPHRFNNPFAESCQLVSALTPPNL